MSSSSVATEEVVSSEEVCAVIVAEKPNRARRDVLCNPDLLCVILDYIYPFEIMSGSSLGFALVARPWNFAWKLYFGQIGTVSPRLLNDPDAIPPMHRIAFISKLLMMLIENQSKTNSKYGSSLGRVQLSLYMYGLVYNYSSLRAPLNLSSDLYELAGSLFKRCVKLAADRALPAPPSASGASDEDEETAKRQHLTDVFSRYTSSCEPVLRSLRYLDRFFCQYENLDVLVVARNRVFDEFFAASGGEAVADAAPTPPPAPAVAVAVAVAAPAAAAPTTAVPSLAASLEAEIAKANSSTTIVAAPPTQVTISFVCTGSRVIRVSSPSLLFKQSGALCSFFFDLTVPGGAAVSACYPGTLPFESLTKVVELFQEHERQGLPRLLPVPIAKPLSSSNPQDFLPPICSTFIQGLSQEELFEVILISNQLELSDLLDIGSAAVASMIRGRTPEEIRTMFNISNEFNPEDEAQVAAENQWVNDV